MHYFVGCMTICLAAFVYSVSAQTWTDATNLRTQMFTTNGYDKKIRPMLNQSEVIKVNTTLTILSVIDFSEASETITIAAYLSIYWHDEYLVWNASDYGGISMYHWPQEDIWKPDVSLKNSILDYKELGIDNLNVEVNSDGLVEWYPMQVFHSSCSVDVTYFPFDTQTCILKFGPWSYESDYVTLQGEGDGVFTADEYETHPIWDILQTDWSSNVESSVSTISFSFKLKRKPQFVLLSVIMPIVMLAVLNLFVFVLPSESGEKSGYAMTVFLAFAVFLTIISTALPENSNSVAIFSIFLIIQVIQSTVITLIALALVRFSFFDDSIPVPNFLQVFVRLLTCKKWRDRSNSIIPIKHNKNPEVVSIGQLEDGEVSMGSGSEYIQDQYTWKKIVHQLDIICFVFFFTVLILSLLICGATAAIG